MASVHSKPYMVVLFEEDDAVWKRLEGQWTRTHIVSPTIAFLIPIPDDTVFSVAKDLGIVAEQDLLGFVCDPREYGGAAFSATLGWLGDAEEELRR